MCQTCQQLYDDIDRAERAGDQKKADVLRTILAGHQANTCPDCRRPVVEWQNGVTWKVRG